MQTLDGHFDGKVVVLDEPTNLAPNTKVKILALGPLDIEKALVSDFAKASEQTFGKIWDNPLDAEYDRI
jgi:hypothetical protein